MKDTCEKNSGNTVGINAPDNMGNQSHEPDAANHDQLVRVEMSKTPTPQRTVSTSVEPAIWEMALILRREHHLRIGGVVKVAVEQAIKDRFIRERQRCREDA